MKKRNYELIALITGVVINVIQGVIGVLFYFVTDSISIFLDAIISVILCFSSIGSILISKYVNKKNTDQYPFGRKVIENMFLLFRSFLMLAIIGMTIFDGIKTIVAFFNHSLTQDTYGTNLTLIIYCILMVGLCIVLMFVYAICYKKSQPKSEIVRIEIKASLYDGLVTLFAISSLLIFQNVPFLSGIAPIGDAITVLILSIFYLYSPVVEIRNQLKILVDKRRSDKTEAKLIKILSNKFEDFAFNDIYFAFTGSSYQIFISLFPNKELTLDEIEEEFCEIRAYLKSEYEQCKIFLMVSKKMIHQM